MSCVPTVSANASRSTFVSPFSTGSLSYAFANTSTHPYVPLSVHKADIFSLFRHVLCRWLIRWWLLKRRRIMRQESTCLLKNIVGLSATAVRSSTLWPL